MYTAMIGVNGVQTQLNVTPESKLTKTEKVAKASHSPKRPTFR